VKIAFVFRHGIKDQNGHVTIDCLKDIMEKGIPAITPDPNIGFVYIHRGSIYLRTEETVRALQIWLLRHDVNIYEMELEHDPVLGNDYLFNSFTPEVKKIMSERGLTHYIAVKKLMPDTFLDWRAKLGLLFRDIFHYSMEWGDIMLIPCHSPTVEMVYNMYAEKPDDKMVVKELDGVFVLQIKGGRTIAIR